MGTNDRTGTLSHGKLSALPLPRPLPIPVGAMTCVLELGGECSGKLSLVPYVPRTRFISLLNAYTRLLISHATRGTYKPNNKGLHEGHSSKDTPLPLVFRTTHSASGSRDCSLACAECPVSELLFVRCVLAELSEGWWGYSGSRAGWSDMIWKETVAYTLGTPHRDSQLRSTASCLLIVYTTITGECLIRATHHQ